MNKKSRPFNRALAVIAAIALPAGALVGQGAAPVRLPEPQGKSAEDGYQTEYVRLGLPNAEALVFRPAGAQPSRIALVFAHPNGNTFQERIGGGMARRGFAIAMVNVRTPPGESDDPYAPAISQAIRFMRAQPGVEKVVLVGHSGGGHLAAFYQNVAENGPLACSGPEKIYPCRKELVTGLQKPDGLVLLDPTLGAFHQAHSIDPAVSGQKRERGLDMFAAENGFDPSDPRGALQPSLHARFLSAQAARSNRITADAEARLRAIESGRGQFNDDEPFVVRGMGVTSSGARLYQPDRRLLAHTRGSYAFHKIDGTIVRGHDPFQPAGAWRTFCRSARIACPDGAEHHGAPLSGIVGHPHRARLCDRRGHDQRR